MEFEISDKDFLEFVVDYNNKHPIKLNGLLVKGIICRFLRDKSEDLHKIIVNHIHKNL